MSDQWAARSLTALRGERAPAPTAADGRHVSASPDHGPSAARPLRRGALVVALVLALAGTAALTLRPVGDGWTWGAPVIELRWYQEGLRSPGTVVQLVGNLVLLMPAAVAAVLAEPRLARPLLLVPVALGAGSMIELLQWRLPLGRVVSPVDAALNAAGATLAGLLTGLLVRLLTRRPAGTTACVVPRGEEAAGLALEEASGGLGGGRHGPGAPAGR